MSHVLGLELRREAPPLLGPLLSSFPLPAGSWPSQILRSNHGSPSPVCLGKGPLEAAARHRVARESNLGDLDLDRFQPAWRRSRCPWGIWKGSQSWGSAVGRRGGEVGTAREAGSCRERGGGRPFSRNFRGSCYSARGGRAEWDARSCCGLGPRPPPPAARGPCSAIPEHTDPVRRGRSAPPGSSVMVGPPEPRVVVGSPRPRVIVGTIRPRVIVGSARARPPPDGTSRPHLAAEESPRPRVILGTPRARVIVGSPRPRMIVSSPWPAVVVASPRPRAPGGSPWPRVIVGTPRSRVIVGSPRARVAGADQAPVPSRGSPQGRRRDEHSGAGAEGPRPGGAAPGRLQGHVGLLAAVGCGREEAAPDQLEAWAQPCHPARSAASGWSPTPAQRSLAAGHGPGVGESHSLRSLSVPEEGGRFARAQRLQPPRHLRLPGAPDRHRGVS